MKNEPKLAFLDKFLSKEEQVRRGQMFGYPAYYVGRSMFACLYEGKVGLKVPEETAIKARARKGITDFRPYGKPKMREWIQFDIDSEEGFYRYKALFDIAIQYARMRNRNK